MQNLNGNFDNLCAELQRMILEELPLPDLMAFANTRTENNEGVKLYMEERRKTLFRAFIEDLDAFIKLMERTGTVISGSSALHLFQPKSEALELQDLDMYTTQEFEETVLKHFKDAEGYKVKDTIIRKKEYDSSAIVKIHKLANEEKKLDVIVTDWASAIVPILQFHSTAVMNYITADTLVALYPKWTAEKKSLVNPAVYMDNRSCLRTLQALMKYVRRGFHVSAEPLDLGMHNCHRSPYCPGTTRNTIDEETLRWEFSPMKTLGKTRITCSDMAVIVWSLGGDGCDRDGQERSQAYIGVTA